MGGPEPTARGASEGESTIDEAPAVDEETKLGTRTRKAEARVAPGDERIGAVVGSYRLLEKIGDGGMGHVYRAEHTALGRVVAIKFLRRDYARRRDAIARFFQEARAVAQIRHRHIVDILDFVQQDGGDTYMVMEHLAGRDLAAWARGGATPPDLLLVIAQVADALAAAHAVGVVHRDLKPDNVVIVAGDDGGACAKLLDFGVAKLLTYVDPSMMVETAAGAVIGTPGYLSPEQAGGGVVDGRTDLYALGAILYELTCGQPMFRGDSFADYVRLHLTEAPIPPRATRGGAGMPPSLEAVILRCVEKEPDARFAGAAELAHALRAIAEELLANARAPTRPAPRRASTPALGNAATAAPSRTSPPGYASLPRVGTPPAGHPVYAGTSTPPPGYPGTSTPPPGYPVYPGTSTPPPGYPVYPGASASMPAASLSPRATPTPLPPRAPMPWWVPFVVIGLAIAAGSTIAALLVL